MDPSQDADGLAHCRRPYVGLISPRPCMARKKRASAHPLPIASAIRARRRRLGLTLQELAAKSGLSAPFLSQPERNHATPSSTSLIPRAAALDVAIQYSINPPPFS